MQYVVRRCWLGAVLIAGSEGGISALLLGEDPGSLVRSLSQRFPGTVITASNAQFEELADRIVRFLEGSESEVPAPLDLRGTDFERQVWAALREIPAGSTVAYSEIARRIGAPAASREVAEACAANPVAVLVPCHRVVRKNGALGGYRWGVGRKRALLAREATASGATAS